ncbi:MAG TPA: response regulator transcription factor [Gammaproteobacteria bacterium]
MEKFKTLLIEDNLIYRGVLKHALMEHFENIDTREASDEFDALETLDTYIPDLVIVDIHLKTGANGLELTRQIKLDHPEVVVAILSQHDIPEYRAVALQNGAEYFLSKSTSLENIFDFVESILIRKNYSH